MNPNFRMAILIDADNADPTIIEQMINETAKFGRVTIKRIYGDWTSPKMNGWKKVLNSSAIRPIQKFAYTTGKNSTDTALIIDAMDILHSKQVEGYCFVSSDSDYTGIVHRIREEGYFVMAIGKSHTPEAFIKACEHFTYEEILKPHTTKPEIKEKPHKQKKTFEAKPPEKPVVNVAPKVDLPDLTNKITKKPIDIDFMNSAFDMVADDVTGEVLASRLATALKQIDPTFDTRNYGHTSFKKFLEALGDKFELFFVENNVLAVKRKV